jgi:hypothetical protein
MDQESSTGEKLRVLPPPGNGEQIYEIDPMLRDYKYHLGYRYALFLSLCTFIYEITVFIYLNICLMCHKTFEDHNSFIFMVMSEVLMEQKSDTM